MAIITAPILHGSSFHAVNRNVPMDVPTTIATKVLISSRALARERSISGSISGTMPYFAGLKTVECSAMRKSTKSIHGTLVVKNAARPHYHGEDLECLDADEHGALAYCVGKMAGVTGEEQGRNHEDRASEREVEAA